MPGYVAYYRVSTERQGRSGLGLDAQRVAVEAYLAAHEGELLAAFTEVETAKGRNPRAQRPELAAAMQRAKYNKATLVIAKLDRLSRNVAFIAQLMDSGVDFVAADLPDASRFVLHIMAAVAEKEREMISDRTRAALSAAKARGTVLGANGHRLAAANKAAAAERLAPISGTLASLLDEGLSVRAMVARLNTNGVISPAGGRWHVSNLHRALRRIGHERDPL